MRSITLKGPTNLSLSFLVLPDEGSSKRGALLLPLNTPTICGAYRSSTSSSLRLASDDPWHSGLAARCAERS